MTTPTRRVQVAGVPARTFLRSAEHLDELVREFQLLELGSRAGEDDPSVPVRLRVLISEVLDRISDVREEVRRQATDAVERGEDEVVLDLPFDPEAAAAVQHLYALLEKVDLYCEEGDLMTLAAPDDVRDFRRWFAGELAAKFA